MNDSVKQPIVVHNFQSAKVVVNDAANVFQTGDEVTAHVKYEEKENLIRIDIPEKKSVQKKDKPKPTNVWTGPSTGVKGTIAVSGNPMVSLNMPNEKMLALGKKMVKQELDTAFDKVYDYVAEHSA